MLDKCYLQTHVTALKYIGPQYLLEGCGGYLQVYDVSSNTLLQRIDLFRGSRIHGIRHNRGDSNAVVFGAKQLAVLQLHQSDGFCSVSVLWQFVEADWIRDAKLLDSQQIVALLTSHNRVILRDVRAKEWREEIAGDDQCILYCGEIQGETRQQLTVLAGTVFGEILIWAASGFKEERRIYHRLSGHNGVIFSVHFDRSSGTIVSTSDDRTVRTWAVRSDEPSGDVRKALQLAEIVALHELYGHEARVWNSLIVRRAGSVARIVTLGEDSCVAVWNMDTGALVTKLDAHPGSSVWAADWNGDLDLLVTGGGDGSTRIWTAEHLKETKVRQLLLDAGQAPRLAAVSSSFVFTLTHQGIVYAKDFSGDWVEAFRDPSLSTNSVWDSNNEAVIIGTQTGDVFVFSCRPAHPFKLLDVHRLNRGKIYNIHLMGAGQQYLVCLDQGQIELRSLLGDGPPLAKFLLPECKQRWPGCALLISDGLLVVGDRDGSLHLFANESEIPIQSFQHVHGKNGLTDVKADPSNERIYHTAGKDGRVGLWRLETGGKTRLELLSVTATSLGWISRLSWIASQLVYLAFHGDRFVVWSSQEQRCLMQVPCGGGHRSWDFSVHDGQARFVFVKDRQLCEIQRSTSSVFRPNLPGRCGGHSKSVGRAKLIDGPLLLTGSEDTFIKVSRLVDGGGLRCLTTIPRHVSSVRALAVKQLRSRPGTWLCVSAGGRAQLSVSLLTATSAGGDDDKGHHVICRDFKTHFLRGWLHRSSSKPWTEDTPTLVPDPETRFMDADVVERDDGLFHVVAACSDGYVRVYEVDVDERRLELLQELEHHHCCVLVVRLVQQPGGQRPLLLSSGTDGRLAVWNLAELGEGETFEPLGFVSVHQSGVNSLDARWLTSERLFLLSGGDDNALTCSRFEVDFVGRRLSLVNQTSRSPHAAQISGVALMGNAMAVSVSLDQRLTLWHLTNDGQLVFASSICCDVADIQGLDVLETPSAWLICVYGQGVEIIRYSPRVSQGCL